MSQGSLKPKIRFLGQKLYNVAHPHTQTRKLIEMTGFQECNIIKDLTNTNSPQMDAVVHKYWSLFVEAHVGGKDTNTQSVAV